MGKTQANFNQETCTVLFFAGMSTKSSPYSGLQKGKIGNRILGSQVYPIECGAPVQLPIFRLYGWVWGPQVRKMNSQKWCMYEYILHPSMCIGKVSKKIKRFSQANHI